MKYMRFLSRLLILALLLCGCSQESDEIIIVDDNEKAYIEPIADVKLFEKLNDSAINLLFTLNGYKEMSNGQLKTLDKQEYQNNLIDIYGNEISLSSLDKYIIEIVSTTCSHCKEQIEKYNDQLIAKHKDITFIEFFVDGKEEVLDLYERLGKQVPKDAYIVCEDEPLYDYLIDIGVEYSPSMICFNNQKVVWTATGVIDYEEFDVFYNTVFNDDFHVDLVDNYGQSIFYYQRTKDILINEINEQKYQRLLALDNDGHSEEITLANLSQRINFNNIYKGDTDAYSEINDFSEYKTKNTIVFFILLNEEDGEGQLKLLRQIEENYQDQLAFINILIESGNSSFDLYKKMSVHVNYLVSSDASLPSYLKKVDVYNYPTAMFIKKGTITGAYSNVLDYNSFNEALELFLNDSIAYKD